MKSTFLHDTKKANLGFLFTSAAKTFLFNKARMQRLDPTLEPEDLVSESYLKMYPKLSAGELKNPSSYARTVNRNFVLTEYAKSITTKHAPENGFLRIGALRTNDEGEICNYELSDPDTENQDENLREAMKKNLQPLINELLSLVPTGKRSSLKNILLLMLEGGYNKKQAIEITAQKTGISYSSLSSLWDRKIRAQNWGEKNMIMKRLEEAYFSK